MKFSQFSDADSECFVPFQESMVGDILITILQPDPMNYIVKRLQVHSFDLGVLGQAHAHAGLLIGLVVGLAGLTILGGNLIVVEGGHTAAVATGDAGGGQGIDPAG